MRQTKEIKRRFITTLIEASLAPPYSPLMQHFVHCLAFTTSAAVALSIATIAKLQTKDVFINDADDGDAPLSPRSVARPETAPENMGSAQVKLFAVLPPEFPASTRQL